MNVTLVLKGLITDGYRRTTILDLRTVDYGLCPGQAL